MTLRGPGISKVGLARFGGELGSRLEAIASRLEAIVIWGRPWLLETKKEEQEERVSIREKRQREGRHGDLNAFKCHLNRKR